MGSAKAQVPAPGQLQKKKKKNDPLKPQPAWLFPPDEENPVLNPKVKPPEQVEKETRERLAAIDFLKHRAVGAPMKAAPPTELLQLVGAFLTSYGFNSTSRVFTVERDARKKIDGYNDDIGKKFAKDMPTLLQIFQDWHHEWMLKHGDGAQLDEDTSSGEEEDEESSSDESSSDSKLKTEKKADGNVSSDSSDSDSDSDSDSENEEKAKAKAKARPSKTATPAQVNGKKRKSPVDSDSDSESSSESSDEDSETPSKKQKIDKKKNTATVQLAKKFEAVKPAETIVSQIKAKKEASSASSDSESSDSDSSDSDSSDSESSDSGEHPKKPVSAQAAANVDGTDLRGMSKTSTDSSHTLNGDTNKVAKVSSASDSSSESSSASDHSDSSSEEEKSAPKSNLKSQQKRKRSKSPHSAQTTPAAAAVQPSAKMQKSRNEPFSRIPKDTKVDPRLSSNAYVPYDYAQRAHEDLIVTKGKGFTKEKNKKKRGSYRGGAIDVNGGKGIKFED